MIFHFVVNPAGASGRTGHEFRRLQPVLKACRQDVRIHYSERGKGIEETCREVLREAKEQGEETVNLVIVGGDGTFNQAVNAVTDFSGVRMGLIPAGSANDMAKSLGLPKRPEDVLRIILQGKTRRKLDICAVSFHALTDAVPGTWAEGKTCGERRFAVSCGIGYDAAICHDVDVSSIKKVLNGFHIGSLIYIFVAIRLIFLTKTKPASISYDGLTKEYDRCLFAVCMNTQYEGGGFRFCPEADWNDGMLDVCISNPRHNIVFFKAFPMAYSGAHVKLTNVFTEERAGRVHIRTKEPLWVHTDGEVACRSDDITLRADAGSVRLLM